MPFVNNENEKVEPHYCIPHHVSVRYEDIHDVHGDPDMYSGYTRVIATGYAEEEWDNDDED